MYTATRKRSPSSTIVPDTGRRLMANECSSLLLRDYVKLLNRTILIVRSRRLMKLVLFMSQGLDLKKPRDTELRMAIIRDSTILTQQNWILSRLNFRRSGKKLGAQPWEFGAKTTFRT